MIPPIPFLLSVAGLGVSLAGFSGLVAAFRRGATWQKVDSYFVLVLADVAEG